MFWIVRQILDFHFLTSSERFVTILKNCFFSMFPRFFVNLQKSIKSDVSDMNGHQKRVCREENMLIYPRPGQIDF